MTISKQQANDRLIEISKQETATREFLEFLSRPPHKKDKEPRFILERSDSALHKLDGKNTWRFTIGGDWQRGLILATERVLKELREERQQIETALAMKITTDDIGESQ